MGDTAINVPVETRTHEVAQLHEFVPQMCGDLQEVGLDEAAAEVQRIYDEHISGVTADDREDESFAAYTSMPADDWQVLVRHMNRLRSDKRAEWLQMKLVDRLRDRMEEME